MTNAAPIFVLSAERSGSTLLRYILDTHERIGSPGELLLGQLFASLMRVLVRVRPAMAVQDVEIEAEIFAEAQAIVERIMVGYLRRVGKAIWCDKAPLNIAYLGLIVRLMPNARYICLYRTCLDAAYSALIAGRFGCASGVEGYVIRNPGNLAKAMVENWVDKNEWLMAFENGHPDSCVRVRYEDMVTDPVREMTRVFSFLGLEWDRGILAAALTTPHYEGGGDNKIKLERSIHQRSVGAGAQFPLEMLPAPLVDRANTILAKLGYVLIEPGRTGGQLSDEDEGKGRDALAVRNAG